jgi:hypothetical protein
MTVVQAAMDGANGIDIDGRNIRVAFASEKPQGERARMRLRSWGCHRSRCGGACGCSLEIARLRARFQAAAAAAATVVVVAAVTVAAAAAAVVMAAAATVAMAAAAAATAAAIAAVMTAAVRSNSRCVGAAAFEYCFHSLVVQVVMTGTAAAAAAATVAAAAVATVAAVIVINDMRLRILLPALAALCSFGVFCSSSARRRASASRQFSEQCKFIASCNIVPKMRAKNARGHRGEEEEMRGAAGCAARVRITTAAAHAMSGKRTRQKKICCIFTLADARQAQFQKIAHES